MVFRPKQKLPKQDAFNIGTEPDEMDAQEEEYDAPQQEPVQRPLVGRPRKYTQEIEESQPEQEVQQEAKPQQQITKEELADMLEGHLARAAQLLQYLKQ